MSETSASMAFFTLPNGNRAMIRTRAAVIACMITLSLCLSVAEAQQRQQRSQSRFRSPQRRPTTSPYLNLLGGSGGRGLGFNYFRNVRPEQEFRRNDARLGRAYRGLRQDLNQQRQLLQSSRSQLSATGHATFFQNYGSFFPRRPQR